MKKLSQINETSWGGMVRRSSSEIQRKEVVIPGNIKEIQWVDFGDKFNFLVADRFFEMDDETYFFRDDIYDEFPLNVGGKEVRLFTEKEFDDFAVYTDVKETYDGFNKISIDKESIVLPQEIIDNKIDTETMLSGTDRIGMFSIYVRSQSICGRPKKYRVLLIKKK